MQRYSPLNSVDRVERRIGAGEAGDRRVQAAAGDQQQRKAGTGLLIVDANGAFFVKAHGGLPARLLRNTRGAAAIAVAAAPVVRMVRLIGSIIGASPVLFRPVYAALGVKRTRTWRANL